MSDKKARSSILFELPQSTVGRLVRNANPNMNLNRDAKEAITKMAGVFVLYLSHNSNLAAQEQKRLTIEPRDIFKALKAIEFGEFCEELNQNLEKWKEEQTVKQLNKQKKKEQKENNAENENHSFANPTFNSSLLSMNANNQNIEQNDNGGNGNIAFSGLEFNSVDDQVMEVVHKQKEDEIQHELEHKNEYDDDEDIDIVSSNI